MVGVSSRPPVRPPGREFRQTGAAQSPVPSSFRETVPRRILWANALVRGQLRGRRFVIAKHLILGRNGGSPWTRADEGVRPTSMQVSGNGTDEWHWP